MDRHEWYEMKLCVMWTKWRKNVWCRWSKWKL